MPLTPHRSHKMMLPIPTTTWKDAFFVSIWGVHPQEEDKDKRPTSKKLRDGHSSIYCLRLVAYGYSSAS